MEEKKYNKIFALLGGRKFVSVILASIITFTSIIWAFILQNNVIHKGSNYDSNVINSLSDTWSFCKTIVPTYFVFLSAYAGLQIWQKKIENNNNKIFPTSDDTHKDYE